MSVTVGEKLAGSCVPSPVQALLINRRRRRRSLLLGGHCEVSNGKPASLAVLIVEAVVEVVEKSRSLQHQNRKMVAASTRKGRQFLIGYSQLVLSSGQKSAQTLSDPLGESHSQDALASSLRSCLPALKSRAKGQNYFSVGRPQSPRPAHFRPPHPTTPTLIFDVKSSEISQDGSSSGSLLPLLQEQGEHFCLAKARSERSVRHLKRRQDEKGIRKRRTAREEGPTNDTRTTQLCGNWSITFLWRVVCEWE